MAGFAAEQDFAGLIELLDGQEQMDQKFLAEELDYPHGIQEQTDLHKVLLAEVEVTRWTRHQACLAWFVAVEEPCVVQELAEHPKNQ